MTTSSYCGRGRCVLAGLLALALVGGLSGCDAIAVSSIAIRVDGGEVEFMVCQGMSVEHVRVETRALPDDWQAVVARPVQMEISDAQVVTLSQLAAAPTAGISLRPREQILISLSNSEETQSASFEWPETQPRGWLTNDGAVTNQPCEA